MATMASESTATTTEAVCIKVASLRTHGYTDFEDWLAYKRNVYTGRHGRIFIHNSDGTKRVFHYGASKWANPHKVDKEHSVKKAVELYLEYLFTSGLIKDLEELRGKRLGCFCHEAPCHAMLLADLLNRGIETVLKEYGRTDLLKHA